MGICFVASAAKSKPLQHAYVVNVLESIQYQGATQSKSKHLGLNHAIYGWSIWDNSRGDAEEALLRCICAYFTLEVFALLMMDNGTTQKVIHALKSIDTFGIFNDVTSASICA